MGINKKRDKKNFQKFKKNKHQKQHKPLGAHDGVVDFLDAQETRKYTSMDPKAKKLMKQFNKKCKCTPADFL